MSEQDRENIAAIRAIVEARLPRGAKIDEDTRLVSGGLIDSMSIVDLILDLENATGVRIPASEVEPEDFDSLRTIAQTIASFRR